MSSMSERSRAPTQVNSDEDNGVLVGLSESEGDPSDNDKRGPINVRAMEAAGHRIGPGLGGTILRKLAPRPVSVTI